MLEPSNSRDSVMSSKIPSGICDGLFSRLRKEKAGTRYSRRQAKATWPPARRLAFDIQESRSFGVILGLVIATNCLCIVMETEIGARCTLTVSRQQCFPEWLRWFNAAFLAIYTVESILRIYTYRKRFFTCAWDMFDLLIILLGYVDMILVMMNEASLSGLQMLRVFRVAKLIRAAKFVRLVPELNAMVRGFISSMHAMFWGLIMINLLLLFWAVLAVEFLGQVSKEVHEDDKCLQAFSGVFPTVLMFFQTLVAGDSWGACSIPLMNHPTHGAAAIFIFVGSLVTVVLGFTNLILAVIVQRAQDASDQDKQAQITEKQRMRQEAEHKLEQMCIDMDTDNNGTVSYNELIEAYEVHEDLRECLHTLDIDRRDLQSLFQLMDTDGSGDLTYEELIACIHKFDTNDLKRQMMMLRLQMEDIWVRVRNHLDSEFMQKLRVDQPDNVKPPPPRAVAYCLNSTPAPAFMEHSHMPSTNSQLHPKTSTCDTPPVVPELQDKHSPSADAAILQELDLISTRVDAHMSSLRSLNTTGQQEARSLPSPQPVPSLGPTAVMYVTDGRSELLESPRRLNGKVAQSEISARSEISRVWPEKMAENIAQSEISRV